MAKRGLETDLGYCLWSLTRFNFGLLQFLLYVNNLPNCSDQLAADLRLYFFTLTYFLNIVVHRHCFEQ